MATNTPETTQKGSMNEMNGKYLKDAKGRLVPEELVKPLDQLRDEMVRTMIQSVKEKQAELIQFKQSIQAELNAFLEQSATEYGTTLGGTHGNVSLVSFDGTQRVSIMVSEIITFDERIQIAKQKIDDCIKQWSQGADSKLIHLVQDAFQVDKEGRISKTRVLSLFRVDMQDPLWTEAMVALRDSITVSSTKSYFTFHVRETPTEKWKLLPLDFAAL